MSSNANRQSDGAHKGVKKNEEATSIGSGFKEQALHERSDLELMKRLGHYMAPYKLIFLGSILLLPVLSALELVQPYLLKIIIDDHIVPRQLEGVALLCLLLLGSLVFRQLTGLLQLYWMQLAGQRALHDLRVELFAHVQSLSVSYFHKHPVGRLMTRLTTDVESLQEALSSGMITMIGDLFTLLSIVAMLLWLDYKLALVSFLVVPPLVGLTSVFRYFLRGAFRDIRVKIARLNAHLQESITGMSIIQAFVREHVSLEEYTTINAAYRQANVKSVRYDAMLYAVVEAAGSITVGTIIWYGSGLALENVITLGVLIAFIEYMQKFFVPIRDLAQKYNLLQSAMASSERIFQLLDAQEKLPSKPDPRPTPARDAPLHIEFRNVWFAYKEDEWVLRDVSFCIEPGQKVALVGHTGAGKSTVMNLLLRLHDVTRGQILANGVDIREFDESQWRSIFAVVLQDSFLFRASIFENIALSSDATREEVERASKQVHVHELISRYPTGYDHQIKERGSNLSAGERQLLCFARALVHDPQVLLLDEATANVDTETETLMQQALDVLLAHQTSLVIAHRLSTIRRADTILVLHRGQLIEEGSHEELLRDTKGHYAQLHALQYGHA